MRRARIILVPVFAAVVAFSPVVGGLGPASAQTTEPSPGATPREMLESGTEMILRAFELMLKAIPQYEAPEVLENGDIIIRRKKPLPENAPSAPKDPAAPDRTKT